MRWEGPSGSLGVNGGGGLPRDGRGQVVTWHKRGWGFAKRQGGCDEEAVLSVEQSLEGGCNGDLVLLVAQSLEPGNGL